MIQLESSPNGLVVISHGRRPLQTHDERKLLSEYIATNSSVDERVGPLCPPRDKYIYVRQKPKYYFPLRTGGSDRRNWSIIENRKKNSTPSHFPLVHWGWATVDTPLRAHWGWTLLLHLAAILLQHAPAIVAPPSWMPRGIVQNYQQQPVFPIFAIPLRQYTASSSTSSDAVESSPNTRGGTNHDLHVGLQSQWIYNMQCDW